MIATDLAPPTRLLPAPPPALPNPKSPAPALEPRWLRAAAFGSASAVAAFGAVGLTLAVAGVYRPILAFSLGAVLWIAMVVWARPLLRAPGATNPAAHGFAGAAVSFVASVALWNARNASQHVLIDRDGGAYVNAGRWIATHGNLRVPINPGPFANQPALKFNSLAVYGGRTGVLSFQFAHLLPALLAEARGLGGDHLMFATPALLSSIALLALFVAAWRLLRNPMVALAAVVSFALLIPEVSFSRDTYSEIPSQVLIFTGLWLLADKGALRRSRTAMIAGVMIGLLQAARIDALAAMVGLPLLFAITWIRADAHDRPLVARTAGACALGLVPGLILGFTDVALRSSQYLHNMGGDVKELVATMLLSILISLAAVALAPRVSRRGVHMPRAAGWIAPATVVTVGFGAWFVRPRIEQLRIASSALVAELQVGAHVTVDATRSYWERSMVWMTWYLGPVTVAAAIVAAALLARSVIRRRSLEAMAAIALLGPVSVLYLWRADASPDQDWVMRRFLISALPLLTLLAFGLVAAMARWVPARFPRWVPIAGATALGIVAVVYPLNTVAPIGSMSEQRGDVRVIDDACQILGPNAAVVVLQDPSGRIYETVPQTLRDWCGTTVAIETTNAPDRAALKQLAAQWSNTGTTLWVVAGDTSTIQAVLPTVSITSTPVVTDSRLLEQTLFRRPSHYTSEQFSLAMARVPTD